MKKKLLLLASCCLPLTVLAQRPLYDLPIQPFTINDMITDRGFAQFCLKGVQPPAKKPTVIRQRMIAGTYRRANGNATPQLQDSTRYVYSGLRGISPERAAYNVQTTGDYDTAFIFLSTDNFTTAQPYYSQQFNSNNDLIQSKKYATPSAYPEQKWLEYSAANKLQKGISLAGVISSAEWRYREITVDEAGRITSDSAASMSTATGLDLDINETRYGTNGRKENARLANKSGSSGIDYETLSYYFYSNTTAVLPYKDSTVTTSTSGGSTTITSIAVGTYTYDASGNLTEYTGSDELAHQLYAKTTCTYNASGQVLTRITQTYDQATSSWRNHGKTDYAYSPSGMTYNADSNWDLATNSWKEMTRITISYNTAGLRDTMKGYVMNVLYNTFTYAYDNNNNLSRYALYLTSSAGNLVTSDIYNYYYEDYEDGKTGTGNIAKHNLPVNIYPNPAGNTLHYNITTGKQLPGLQLSLYDISGRKVYTTPLLQNEGATDVSALISGIYYIEISSTKQNQVSRQRFVKQ